MSPIDPRMERRPVERVGGATTPKIFMACTARLMGRRLFWPQTAMIEEEAAEEEEESLCIPCVVCVCVEESSFSSIRRVFLLLICRPLVLLPIGVGLLLFYGRGDLYGGWMCAGLLDQVVNAQCLMRRPTL